MNGHRVRAARRSRHLTQRQLSELSGVDQRTLSDIEVGRVQDPGYSKIVNLARALEVDPNELWPIPRRRPSHSDIPQSAASAAAMTAETQLESSSEAEA